MSKQSSVDFIIKEFSDILGQLKTQPIQDLLLLDAVQKAKAMHKEEHGLTWDKSIENFEARGRNEVRAIVDFDEYYNQTFEQ